MREEIEKLEAIYERLLDQLGIEMIEGCGLEGDWEVMTDEQKEAALEAAIAECEDRIAEREKEEQFYRGQLTWDSRNCCFVDPEEEEW